jgi:hypothetical protein
LSSHFGLDGERDNPAKKSLQDPSNKFSGPRRPL